MATVRSIANEAKVSIATVSRVLNHSDRVSPDIRGRVERVAGKLGYRTERRPSTSSTIALAYTSRSSLDSTYDMAILHAMSKAASELKFDLAILNLAIDRKSGEAPAQYLRGRGIRGVIVRTASESRQTCIDIANASFPHVVVGDCFEEKTVNYIAADSGPTSYRAIEHLISLGHRRIAIAVNYIPDKDHKDRLAAYEAALQHHGIEVDPKLIYRGGAGRGQGVQVIRNLMSLPDRPTAIFITDPLVAVGAINQAHQMGVKIPEDVSIIGFDDADTRRHVFPVYSAVCQDAASMGYEAMLMLSQLLDSPEIPQRKLIPTLLELHETTGRPPAHIFRILPDGSRIEDSPA